MAFEIVVKSGTPLTPLDDADEVALELLFQIGYLSRDRKDVKDGVGYRLMMNCILARMEKAWYVEELAEVLETSKPTVYRYINKLKSMDLLEECDVELENEVKKGYRIRYGDLSKAWNFVEAHTNVAMENYRKSVDHLQELMEKRRKGGNK